MEVRRVVHGASLHEHADDDAEKPADLGHDGSFYDPKPAGPAAHCRQLENGSFDSGRLLLTGSARRRLSWGFQDVTCRPAGRRRPRQSSSVRAIACKGRRHRWHSWHSRQCGFCNSQNQKEAQEFESHSLRHNRINNLPDLVDDCGRATGFEPATPCAQTREPIMAMRERSRRPPSLAAHGQSERSATAAVKRSSGQTSIPSSVLR